MQAKLEQALCNTPISITDVFQLGFYGLEMHGNGESWSSYLHGASEVRRRQVGTLVS